MADPDPLGQLRRLLLGSRMRGEVGESHGGVVSLMQPIRGALSRTELEPPAVTAFADFYGLSGYPLKLSGGDTLVGRIATPSTDRRAKPASRSTISMLLRTTETAVRAELDLTNVTLPSAPEPDPVSRPWLIRPPALGRAASVVERERICRAGYEAAFDLVSRSEHQAELQEAMRRWAELNAGVVVSTSPMADRRLEPERRNAAHALLAVALHDIVTDRDTLGRVLSGKPTLLPPQTSLPTGRIAVHPKYGAMATDLDADDFILLTGEVMERRNADTAADLLLDLIRQSRHKQLFDDDTAETVLWAFGYGLAAMGSWKTIELTRYHFEHEPRSLTTASMLAWSSHVASLHLHDGLAWRLTDMTEQVMRELATVEDDKRAGIAWQIGLTRSGARMREADRWREHGYLNDARISLQAALVQLRHAETAAAQFDGSPSLSKRMSNGLRRAEILFVAARLRIDGAPAVGFKDELATARQLVAGMQRTLEEAEPEQLDEDDAEQFRGRLELLSAAIQDVLDGPPTT